MHGRVEGFAGGFLLPLRAFRMLCARYGLKRYALLPLVAGFFVYALAIALFLFLIARWHPAVAWDFWGGFGRGLSEAINWSLATLKWLVLVPLIFIASYFTFTTVGMVVAAPFNEMLAERVERSLCEPVEDRALPLRTTIGRLFHGMLDAAAIVGRQLLFSLPALPFLLIPVVGTLPLLVVTAYFGGLGFFDVAMARNGLRNRHKRPVLRDRRAEVLGLGLAMELLFLIPFAGLLVLPLGVVAGTLLYVDSDWQAAIERSGLPAPEGFEPPQAQTQADRIFMSPS